MCFEKSYIFEEEKFLAFDMSSSQPYFSFPYIAADETQIKEIPSSKAQRKRTLENL
jgi:hypothetical protein